MTVLIDTNIFLCAVNEDSEFFEPARAAVERDTQQSFAVTLGILYEFLRVATHRKVFAEPMPAKQALQFVQQLSEHENCYLLLPTKDHFRIVSSQISGINHLSGNLFHDVATTGLMLENGIRTILTHDKDFLRFSEIEVIDPLV